MYETGKYTASYLKNFIAKLIPFVMEVGLQFLKKSAAICLSDHTSTRKMTNIECSKIFALTLFFVYSGQNFVRGVD